MVSAPSIFIASSWSLVVSSVGVTCAVVSSMSSARRTSPSSHETGGGAAFEAFDPPPPSPPATESVGILRYVSSASSSASASWSAALFACRGSVTRSPHPPARNPPALPLAAAATETRSTIVDGMPRLER